MTKAKSNITYNKPGSSLEILKIRRNLASLLLGVKLGQQSNCTQCLVVSLNSCQILIDN